MKVLILALLVSSQVFAGEKVEITVKGMVCAFCSQGITKKFKEERVKDVNVDLEKHLVTLELSDGQKLEHAKIEQILKDSGYGVEKIENK
ncbi:MAG: cation transporter [Bdellovibrionales bacterium]|nr:cation transporter [Bdellovibrionales bacterium]